MPTFAQIGVGDFGTDAKAKCSTVDVNETEPHPALAQSVGFGGTFEGHEKRRGHHVVWRASGCILELTEVSMLPDVEVLDGELRIQFSGELLPEPTISQHDDNSLLLTVAIQTEDTGVRPWMEASR
jgi:hypothetical protein